MPTREEHAIEETCEVMRSQSVMDVIQKRVEQIVYHGYDDEHDSQNTDLELARAATAVLLTYTDNPDVDDPGLSPGNFWPSDWSVECRRRVPDKTPYEQLTMAAAFILAEMDRIPIVTFGMIPEED